MQHNRTIKTGPFKGKKIVFARADGLDASREILEEFMSKIFDFEPGDYLVSDESSLRDFTGLDDTNLSDIQKKIWKVFQIDVTDLESGNLLEIITRIKNKRSGGPGATSRIN